MASGRDRLTDTAVKKRKTKGRMFDGAGLILNVTATGSKNWIFRYTSKSGKVREMGLGGYPTIPLRKARDRADEYRNMVSDGLDPKQERDRESGKTFGDAADSYYQSMKARWTSAKTRHQWETTLKETCKPVRRKPVADVGTDDVLKILTPLWQTTPETARRVRSRIENVLDYSKAKHWRSGENPARWRGHLENVLPKRDKKKRKHFSAMSYKDVPAFMERLAGLEWLSCRALEITILTACRTGEVLKAQWSEIDFESALWTVPAERMKAREEHQVPLPPKVIEILTPPYESRYNKFVFPGNAPGKPLSDMAMIMLMYRMEIKGATVHGFRSSFRDWCGDQTSFAREVAEAALAHQVGSEVERSYRRGTALEKRRQLMNAWADYCQGAAADNVVSLHG
ncbi:MAG: integrase arm-type DNA-binding domain-containing protein [Hyphomicrobiales bacterium]|nr:integrase arm-type DNA-binding domain-containing protein [Hyphomicrobiales bacterium]MCP4998648.1 integrase arm-type DNA-binding domain-containing protein [Hyphomicrobiales bacterium]